MAHYLLINKDTNIAENAIEWDGNATNWSPPETHLPVMLDTTPAVDWVWNDAAADWVAVNGVGNGGVGDSWDGTKLVAPKPTEPPEQADE